MSDNVDKPVEEGLEDSAPPATSRTTDKKALRRKTFKFVFVFVVSVFLLLYGYESIRRSMPNDWYLLQVASSTTFLLKHVGYSCELGSAERFKGREAAVREGLAAWARGEEPPKLPPSDPVQALSGSERPLTAWEAWKYQGLMYRLGIRDAERELARIKSDANLAEPQRSQQIKGVETQLTQMKQREMGPLVMFILKPSLGRKLTDLKLELAALEKNNALSTEARTKRLAEVRSEIAPLEERARQPLEGAADKRDVAFSFIVIPDCGAVQSMAIFVAAILAFPAGWFRRLIGMVVGIPVLYLVNAFRLAFLAVIGAMDNGGEWFKFAHEYVWQGIYIVFVVALWMGWVEFVVRRRSS